MRTGLAGGIDAFRNASSSAWAVSAGADSRAGAASRAGGSGIGLGCSEETVSNPTSSRAVSGSPSWHTPSIRVRSPAEPS